MTIVPSALAAWMMYSILPAREGLVLNLLMALLFAVLFAWVSMGFWSALAGVAVTLLRYDAFAVTLGQTGAESLPQGARAAVLFPVYNEEASRVIEGIRAVWRSLQATNSAGNFDIFILSDSTSPDAWMNEEKAWYDLCRDEGAFSRIFYRHRKANRKGKSGNVADFCRRWGANYPYMVVFDADSLMSGDTLVRMVRAMEARPDIGILQTMPRSMNSRSLISRIQQFSNHLYGPFFAAGLHYWQLGDAQYWGHNAIIRVEPFMKHCHLPVLSGPRPLGGPILSHDFVEAALMRSAGYGVWLACELDDSYEENPPSLIDELVRDRRWCQGNLQHIRLIFAKGFFPTQRALFINGIMSYFSALLWFFFLVVSSLQAIAVLFRLPVYFPDGPSLFVDWPQYFSGWMLALFTGTATLLFLPKLLILVVVLAKRQADGFGGRVALLASAAGELLFSALLAPVRMLYHSLFVATTLVGFTVHWNTQSRNATGTTWGQALRFHWWGVLLGICWGGLIYIVNPEFFVWLSPIVAGMAISIPLSVWTSRASVGESAMRRGLFLTPAETRPSKEIAALEKGMAEAEHVSEFAIPRDDGFIRTVVVPRALLLHVSITPEKPTRNAEKEGRLSLLVEKAVTLGPDALSAQEKSQLLYQPHHLIALHNRIWALDDSRVGKWGIGC